MEENVTNGSE